MPGTDGRLLIYRCKSTDQRRGTRGGFRVICFRHQAEETITLWPLLVYAKSISPKRPNLRTVNALLNELLETLSE